MRQPLWVLAAVLVLMTNCAPGVQSSSRSAAESWLALLDANDFEAAWASWRREDSSGSARNDLEATVRHARNLGAVESRRFLETTPFTDAPGFPPGSYLSVRFETRFAGGRALENVVLRRDSERAWVVTGYLVTQVPSPGTRDGTTK